MKKGRGVGIYMLILVFAVGLTWLLMFISYQTAVLFAPLGYSPPQDVFNSNSQIFFIDLVNQQLNLRIHHPGAYVYKYVYLWSPINNTWQRHTLNYVQAPPSPNTDWLSEEAYLNITNVALNQNEIYVVGYTCKKHSGQWKCGCAAQDDCGYWMLQTFNTTTPTNPTSPIGNISSNLTIINDSGQTVAQFTKQGDIILSGSCTILSSCTPPANSFVVVNDSGSIVSYVDNSGNLCAKGGLCATSSVCNPTNAPFVVTNETDSIVISISAGGELCFIGNLTQQA